MSGTSGDGVDAVLLALHSAAEPHAAEVLAHHHVPFPAALQAELTRPDQLSARRLAELHFLLPRYYRDAALGLGRLAGVACVGMHGQTIWHQPSDPEAPTTLQIGSSAALAQALGLPVVGDLRGADVALGGQGAPIVPFAHWFFLARRPEPTLVVNLGGICNFTWVTPEVADVVAYDVGPGMCLADAFAVAQSGGAERYDRDGTRSRGGRLIAPLCDAIVGHPFVGRAPPKSTGREDFGHAYQAELMRQHHGAHPDRDVAYTLLVATLTCLARAIATQPAIHAGLRRLVLTGGGARNSTLVAAARAHFAPATVEVAGAGVLAPAHHEPAAMALIAARTLAGLPSSLPQVTGAARAAVLGHVHRPTP